MLAMPLKDSRYEYVRTRPRREKDRDHERETRSIGGSSTTTIRDRKNRNSITSNAATSSDTASHSSISTDQNVVQEEMPLEQENQESQSVSTATSPSVGASSISNATSRKLPSHMDTPAELQPYLESVRDTASTVTASSPASESKEWIGPNLENASFPSHPLDSLTSTPKPSDLFGSAGSVSEYQVLSQPSDSEALDCPDTKRVVQAKSHIGLNEMAHSWAGNCENLDNYYYPSQMSNPFLPTSHARPRQRTPAPTNFEDGPQLSSQILPKAPTPPPQQRASLPGRSEPPQYPIERSSVVGHMTQGYWYPMASEKSPVPMHQTQSNPLPYPGETSLMDHPAHLLHRIGSVLPDIGSLMDLYQHTCGILLSRDRHISDLQIQKAAEAKEQTARIDRLTTEIESVLNSNAECVKKLKDEIDKLDDRCSKLQESHANERGLKEEAQLAHASLLAKHGEMDKQHRQEILQKSQTFAREKDSILEERERREKDLIHEMRTAAHVAEMKLIDHVAERDRKHEIDKQAHQDLCSRHKRDVEEYHARVCGDLEKLVRLKDQQLAEERRNHTRVKEVWDRDRELSDCQWEEERASLNKTSKDQGQKLTVEHQKELDDVQRTLDAGLSRQRAESLDTLLEVRGAKDDLRQQREATHTHYELEIQNVAAHLPQEKEDFRRATDAAFSRQKVELQGNIRPAVVDQSDSDLVRSLGISESRHSLEARESTIKLEKETEAYKMGTNVDKCKWPKPGVESVFSRSSTPAPKEDRGKLKRASGMYGSGTSLKSKGDGGYRGHSRERKI